MKTSILTRPVIQFLLAASALGLASCASGPTYAETKSKLPPIAKGQGRVFIYRPSTFGMAVRPSVNIDGRVIGTSEGKGFLYSDQKAGSHEISIATEWNHKNTINVSAGQSSFVECTVTPGVLAAHLIPNQVDAAAAEARISKCRLTEK